MRPDCEKIWKVSLPFSSKGGRIFEGALFVRTNLGLANMECARTARRSAKNQPVVENRRRHSAHDWARISPRTLYRLGCTAMPRTVVSIFSLGRNRTPGSSVALVGRRSSEKCVGGLAPNGGRLPHGTTLRSKTRKTADSVNSRLHNRRRLTPFTSRRRSRHVSTQ